MKKQNVRTLALIVCAFTYLLIGAAIFDVLESKNEAEEKRLLAADEAKFKAEYNITDDDFERLRRVMIKSKHYKGAVQWKFAGSFYFALTVFTTIGYGHSTPKTFGGKLFCIAYALGGIPLGLVMFQSIGERFNILITCIIARAKRCVRARQQAVTQSELIAVACTLCGLVLAAGAAAFSYFENWKFEDAFYYCFITLATIGFGDYVALQEDHALQRRPEYVAFSVLYILFGLTVFAAALNLLVLRLLTMNTEDERKDELEALATARSSVKLDGDVITAAAASAVAPHGAIDIASAEAAAAGNYARVVEALRRGGGGSRMPSSQDVRRSFTLRSMHEDALHVSGTQCTCCSCYAFTSSDSESACAQGGGAHATYDVTPSVSQTMHLLPSKGKAGLPYGNPRLGNDDLACEDAQEKIFTAPAHDTLRSGKRLSI